MANCECAHRPTPPEPVEVWIAASAPVAIERAARLGDGWLAAPGLTKAQAQESLAHYIACCAKHGRAVGVKAIRRDVYVGESAARSRSHWRRCDQSWLSRFCARCHRRGRRGQCGRRLSGICRYGLYRHYHPQFGVGTRKGAGVHCAVDRGESTHENHQYRNSARRRRLATVDLCQDGDRCGHTAGVSAAMAATLWHCRHGQRSGAAADWRRPARL
ncbi:MAG: LLM class flavin-dependent oxidoreductase [Caldilineaceae bacterium]|nr:LLM class flavin-dependent oxidoreductase [Caldilineaceae bacterium]